MPKKLKMLNYLEKFHELRIFSLDEAAAVVGNKHSALVLLNRYANAGLIRRVRRNLYAAVNLGTKAMEVNRFQIASHITPTACVAYHSAFEYYGFAHQVFYTTYVASGSLFNGFECDGMTYQYCTAKLDIGVEVPPMDTLVRVTDLSRTVVDCIDRIDRCGGLEELCQCLNAIPYLDGEMIVRYLEAYDKRALYKKAGFILSHFMDNLKDGETLLDVCRDRGAQGIDRIQSDSQDNVYHKEWGLYAPDNILSFLEQGSYAGL